MVLKLYFIRHGQTPGNLQHRYVGRTDEDLSEKGINGLGDLKALFEGITADRIYTSPMRRCLQTADIIFPGMEKICADGLRECDFGDFEYMNYEDLSGNEDYQAFIDSGGRIAFPGGEEPDLFRKRVVQAFDEILEGIIERGSLKENKIAIVCHGGSIMSVLDRYSYPHRDYFEWMLPNGAALEGSLDTDAWKDGDRKIFDCRIIKA